MRIEPIPYDELDPELRARFDAGLAEGRYTMTAPLQVYAYAPDEAIAMDEAYRLTFRRGRLGPRLQELLRIRSAQLNGCAPCSSSIKEDTVAAADVACLLDGADAGWSNERERLALEFLTLMSNDPDAIDDSTFRGLAAEFSTPEIVELGLLCGRYIGGHRWTHALDVFGTAEPLLRYDAAVHGSAAATGS
jgi:alkylhydroperoxidase family enzyme